VDPEKTIRYLLPEPPRDHSADTLAAFERIWRQAADTPGCELAYELDVPRWQFLAWLVDNHPIVLHGSPLQDLTVVEPRQANDVRDFSAQAAIYAATDGIWVIFFAILNRPEIPMSIFNSAVRIRPPGQVFSPPFYFFSVSRGAYERGPYCPGMVYILSREGFVQDPMNDFGGIEISVPQWAGHHPARPLARLRVTPQDFPFLEHVRWHEPQILHERMQANPLGFPWVEE
jgi:hypothetical protein